MTTGRAPKRSSFGTIRKLPSGRYQARYTVPGTDKLINAPMTYTTKGDADAWLRAERSARERGTWRPAESSTQTLRDYAERWLADRKLKPSTRKHYRVVLDKFILDQIGDRQIAKIDRITVRSWHADLGRVTLAELMHRLGHSTPQTAMRYQHAVAQRDKALAAKLSEMATGATS